MARVTVEDCVLQVPNRFDLVMLAAQRAREVASGAPLSVERDNDKNPVVALREIAEETIDLETLAEALVQGLQKHVETDEPEEDASEFDVPSVTGDTAEAIAGLDGPPTLPADALAVEEAERSGPEDGAPAEAASERPVPEIMGGVGPEEAPAEAADDRDET